MSLIDGLKRKAKAFEREQGIVPLAGMYIAVGRDSEGRHVYYVLSGERDDLDDPLQYFYRLGRSLARNSEDADAQALLNGIIDAIDEPLKEAMKGGEE